MASEPASSVPPATRARRALTLAAPAAPSPLHDPGTDPQGSPSPPPVPAPAAPAKAELSEADLRISAQARALPDLDLVLDDLGRRAPSPPRTLLDLGCGMGGLTVHIGERLGVSRLIGVDYDPDRLVTASARGVETHRVDLSRDEIPVASGSVGLVTSFGLLAYLSLYDNCLAESARLLEDGGWLLLSIPNLGSYGNRLQLLFGFQPHAVAVSEHRTAGTLRGGREEHPSAGTPPLLHGATLRCMRQLLDYFGFDIVVTRGFAPGPRKRAVVDRIAGHFPSLSRRFLILARKRPTAG